MCHAHVTCFCVCYVVGRCALLLGRAHYIIGGCAQVESGTVSHTQIGSPIKYCSERPILAVLRGGVGWRSGETGRGRECSLCTRGEAHTANTLLELAMFPYAVHELLWPSTQPARVLGDNLQSYWSALHAHKCKERLQVQEGASWISRWSRLQTPPTGRKPAVQAATQQGGMFLRASLRGAFRVAVRPRVSHPPSRGALVFPCAHTSSRSYSSTPDAATAAAAAAAAPTAPAGPSVIEQAAANTSSRPNPELQRYLDMYRQYSTHHLPSRSSTACTRPSHW